MTDWNSYGTSIRQIRKRPHMSREEVLRIAREEVGSKGWPWEEHVRASFAVNYFTKRGQWHVQTAIQLKGGNAGVLIDDESGTVLSSGFAPH